MILAAGIGSRLRPLTNTKPKALIEIGGVPMLEIVIKRLIKAGVDEIIINVFHLADQITAFLAAKKNFGVDLEISLETELLDTGGGLKKASSFFNGKKPFFLHNVDVITNLDLAQMYRHHLEHPAIATLAVQRRESGRYFLFDGRGRLCGWESTEQNKTLWAGPRPENTQRRAFAGIHVLSADIFSKINEAGVFSINKTYLRLAGEGEAVQAFDADSCWWADIGDASKLEAARRLVKEHGLPV